MGYALFADAVVIVHFAYVAFGAVGACWRGAGHGRCGCTCLRCAGDLPLSCSAWTAR